VRVYAESNFVLELGLEQEEYQSCQAIVALSVAGTIDLALPAFCLAEPYETQTRRHQERRRLRESLTTELTQLVRTVSYVSAVGQARSATTLLDLSIFDERRRLNQFRDQLLDCARIIPVSAEVFRLAAQSERLYQFSAQDAVVYASVLWDLEQNAVPESCFLNRDRHFADPDAVDRLRGHGCTLIPRFDHGHQFLVSRVNPPTAP
jgi:hypothetical protein